MSFFGYYLSGTVNIPRTHGTLPLSGKKNDLSRFKRGGNVDYTLVRGAAEHKRGTFQGFNEPTVHENVKLAKQRARRFRLGDTVGEKLTVKNEACIAPDIFIGKTLMKAAAKLNKSPTVLWLEGFTAKKRQSVNIAFITVTQNSFDFRLPKGSAVVKIPRLAVKASLAEVSATADKQGDAYADSICGVVISDK